MPPASIWWRSAAHSGSNRTRMRPRTSSCGILAGSRIAPRHGRLTHRFPADGRPLRRGLRGDGRLRGSRGDAGGRLGAGTRDRDRRLHERGGLSVFSRHDGSDLFTGARTLAEVATIRDASGIAQGDALAAVLAADRDVPQRPFRRPIAAFVEPHIEQGPILERDGVSIGIVTGIQGTRRYRVRVAGEAAHAGTAERHERRDAVMAAVRMIAAIDRAASDPPTPSSPSG